MKCTTQGIIAAAVLCCGRLQDNLDAGICLDVSIFVVTIHRLGGRVGGLYLVNQLEKMIPRCVVCDQLLHISWYSF